jgi:hypothetical protein
MHDTGGAGPQLVPGSDLQRSSRREGYRLRESPECGVAQYVPAAEAFGGQVGSASHLVTRERADGERRAGEFSGIGTRWRREHRSEPRCEINGSRSCRGVRSMQGASTNCSEGEGRRVADAAGG